MRRITVSSLVVAVAAALALTAAPAVSAPAAETATAAEAPTYRVVDLGVLPGDDLGIAYGLNERGDVVGWTRGESGLDGLPAPFLYTDAGGIQALPLPEGATSGIAQEVNDRGDVVGNVTSPGADADAVRWPAGGGVELLGSLAEAPAVQSSYAYGTNERRDVAGWSFISPYAFGGQEAFLYRDGRMRSVTPGARPAFGHDVNEVRQVTGEYEYSAFVWTAGTVELIAETLPGNSNGEAINDAGQVAVTQTLPDRNNAWRWTPGVGLESLGLRSTNEATTASGINNSGDVVGRGSVPTAPAMGGYVFTDATGPLYLTDLLEPSATDWYVSDAFDINDRGQIAARALDMGSGIGHAVRLDPVQPACAADCLRVTGLRLTGTDVGDRVVVTARLVVGDETGAPVPGATVTVRWTLPSGRATTATAPTNASGVARLSVEGRRGTYRVTVVDVAAAGSTFDPANSQLTATVTRR